MKKIIFIIFIFLAFATPANALEEYNIDCKENVCSFKGYSSYEVTGIDLRYSVSDKESKFNIDESWQGSVANNIVIMYTDKNKIDDFSIGKLITSKIIDSSDIKIDFLAYYDNNYDEHILINNVNKNENSAKKESKNYYKYIIYGMILLVIIISILIIIKIGVKK